MSDDTIPQDDPRRLTEEELYECAADWSDYRKDFGVPADGRERNATFRAFQYGWRLERTRRTTMQAGAKDELRGLMDSLDGHIIADANERSTVYHAIYDLWKTL